MSISLAGAHMATTGYRVEGRIGMEGFHVHSHLINECCNRYSKQTYSKLTQRDTTQLAEMENTPTKR